MTDTPRPLFVYGILCAPELLAMIFREPNEATSNVAKIRPMLQPATVKGYERPSIFRGSGYALQPAAIASADPEASIDGYLLTLESTSQRRKLDNLEAEGETHKCVPVQVHTAADNQSVAADMYLWNGPMEMISPDPWDFAAFVKDGLEYYLDIFEGLDFDDEDDQ
ncbi:hypothetical protein QBC41DRAFT_266564 [Cercophora samala]|uniref:Putative gamma-glutamylcyclotransferase n=1 Tax=Cercophora samala TaxID=330535 RepID=A0AA39ZM57_9PEZI|nr:hypothetical protein QBC41DRAFT_266564 [Cercophora samala]